MSQTFVVYNPDTGLYLTAIITSPGNPDSYQWGTINSEMMEFETQAEADQRAVAIGGGTVGTTKP